jgi:NAD(P)-dependent dehydrogenase (short-subunit alcohol dehydrogenase family)
VGRLSGKVAIVTGATSGMGRAIAETFAAEGASVVAGGRDQGRGRSVVEAVSARGGQIRFVRSDVATLEGNDALVREARDAFGRIDVLVANAGQLGLGSVTEVPIETWHATLATNLHAVFYLCRLGIPELLKGGGGSVVVNGSIAAFKGLPNHAAYCASKGALVPFVKQIAREYGPSVRANLVCPGPVDTPLIWDSARAFPVPSEAVQAAGANTALKRLGRPEDVAKLVAFLASDESSWMTGSAITIDGGAIA